MSRRRWRCISAPVFPVSAAPSAQAPSCSNSLRLMFSRLASHRCPNGHYLPPTLAVAAEQELVCPECGAHFYAPGAEELAFNSQGACRTCGGTGIVRTVDRRIAGARRIPDHRRRGSGALEFADVVADDRRLPRNGSAHRRALPRADRPGKGYRLQRPCGKKGISCTRPKIPIRRQNWTLPTINAVYTVENALAKVKDEKGMKRVEKFLKEDVCPDCGGTRLSEAARAPQSAWNRP